MKGIDCLCHYSFAVRLNPRWRVSNLFGFEIVFICVDLLSTVKPIDLFKARNFLCSFLINLSNFRDLYILMPFDVIYFCKQMPEMLGRYKGSADVL